MEAKKEEEDTGIQIDQPLLTADNQHEFLPGSPDGIAYLNNEDFLLEYKAPYNLFQSEKAASEAKFLTQINKRHSYFYQI